MGEAIRRARSRHVKRLVGAWALALTFLAADGGDLQAQGQVELDLNANGWLDRLTCANRAQWVQGNLIGIVQATFSGDASWGRALKTTLTLRVEGWDVPLGTRSEVFAPRWDPTYMGDPPSASGPWDTKMIIGLKGRDSFFSYPSVELVARVGDASLGNAFQPKTERIRVNLDCDGAGASAPAETQPPPPPSPPSPPPSAPPVEEQLEPLPLYRVAWEKIDTIAAKGMVADGTNRLRLGISLPGVSSIDVSAGHGRFEDAAGSPLPSRISLPEGETTVLWYRPPDYVSSDWLTSGNTLSLGPSEMGRSPDVKPGPQILTGPRMARDTVTVAFIDGHGNPQARSGGIWVVRPPVVLVHGFVGDVNTWRNFSRFLTNAGYGTRVDQYYHEVNGRDGIRAQAEYLRLVIEDETRRYRKAGFKAGKVDLVAHSMGGLISRAYATRAGYAGDVRKVIMVATPNHGIDHAGSRALGWAAQVRAWSHEGMEEDVAPGSPVLGTLNRRESDGTRYHLEEDVEWGNIYVVGGDRVVSDWTAPLNGVATLELPRGSAAHSSSLVNDAFPVGVLESGRTRDQVSRWLEGPIPVGPLSRWRIAVKAEKESDVSVGDYDPFDDTSWSRWVQAGLPPDSALITDRIKTRTGRAWVRWYRNGKPFAQITMDPGTDVWLRGHSVRRVSVVMNKGRAVFRSFGTGGDKGEVGVEVGGWADGDPRLYDLKTNGTTFAVEANDGALNLTVMDGEVEVDDLGAEQGAPSVTARGQQAVALVPGLSGAARPAPRQGWWDQTLAWQDAERAPDELSDARPREPAAPVQPAQPGGGITMDDAYALDAYPVDFASLGGRITARADQGFTPVGLSLHGGQVHMLYLGAGVMPFTDWQMDWYDTTDQLQAGINGRMNAGYLPNGFAWSENRYYVLYVRTDFTGTAWQIVMSDIDLNAVQRDLQPWLEQDYIPFDVTLAEGRYLTLMIQLPEKIAEQWTIEGSYAPGLKSLIEGKLMSGYFPWGLLVDDVANVLFLGG